MSCIVGTTTFNTRVYKGSVKESNPYKNLILSHDLIRKKIPAEHLEQLMVMKGAKEARKSMDRWGWGPHQAH